MKREIKFRAWQPQVKRMFEVGDIDFIKEEVMLCHWGWESSNDIDLMQYTGLHDKNGREIYEGDIIVAHPKMKYEIPKIGVVQYGDYRPMFQYKLVDGEEYSIWNNDVNRTYEVIGNIFENPELLEEKQ
ncbi:YopX family protein [Lacticaseibacillus paracasei]|uniref:YopX family protein n=1 Tax=Lacticaseibacillus paracasei TaxID=1597 RepID=UPI00272B6B35|nr:YopX family protein [Lacticaseibacillus paracasei]WKZ96848.1 YopX family protein [Lacticaseibacillus paracasei]